MNYLAFLAWTSLQQRILSVILSVVFVTVVMPTHTLAQVPTSTALTKKSAVESLSRHLSENFLGTTRVLLPGKSRGNGMFSLAKAPRVQILKSDEYEHGAVYIKTRQRFVLGKGASSFQSLALMSSLEGINVRSIKPLSSQHNNGSLLTSDDYGIGRIYEVQFEKALDVQRVCRDLAKNPEVEYAEPIPIHKLQQADRVRPRDPFYNNQYQWRLIDAERAWAISRGDTNVVIAICDSGVDVEHEDLKDKIWNNPGETGTDAMGRDKRSNNVDDDGNGRVDDWRGWDFVGNSTIAELNAGVYRVDNNPTPRPTRGISDDAGAFEGLNHGVHVAGIAAAATDNDKGGAGSGYLCRILPIKNGTEDPGAPNSVIRGYEGILYAAQMGAKVVNCSWGGLGLYNQVLQDMVNTATNMGTLVVAAAGNQATLMDDDYFPGSYDNVMSVGASTSSDLPAGFSNYGIKTTVFAPGDDILSTFSENKYGVIGGTSMAAPLTAGIAGLVRSMHPDWSPRQVAQQIRATSDNVLQPGAADRPFNFFGRVNMYRALNTNRTLNGTGDLTPAVVLEDAAIGTPSGVIGDMEPKRLILSYKNILSNARNVSITLTPLDSLIIALQPTVQLGSLNTNEQKDVEFTVQLQSAALTAGLVDDAEFVAIIRADGGYINYERVSLPFQLQTGTAAPGLVVTPVLNFGTTPLPTNATVRISNTGNQGLTVSNATFTGANAGEFSLVSPIDNVQLGAGEFITRQVRFTPTTGATGSRTAQFNVSAISDGKASSAGTPIANGYTFAGRAEAYQEITTNNSNFTRLGAGLDDEEFDVPLGFTFQFGTKSYTSVKAVSNGWLAFNQTGSSISESNFISAPIADRTYQADGIVSAFGLDIFMQANGTITHETQGTAPNRVFVIQWKNASFVDDPYAAASDANLNFQIRLYETSNRIEFRYGNLEFTRDAAFALPAQVGLRGSSPSDFNIRRVGLADNNNWTSSVLGTVSADVCRLHSFGYAPPASGYVYTYTPGDFAVLSAPRVTAFTRSAQLNATAREGGFLGTLPTIARGLDFGAVTIGTVRTLPVTLANYSPNPMTITNLSISTVANASSTEFAIVDAPALPLTLPPNSTRVLQVRYSPSTPDNLSSLITISPLLANLAITHNGVNALLPLLGSGIAQNFVLRIVQDQGADLTGSMGNFSRIDRLPPFPPAGSTAALPPEVFVTVGSVRVIRQYSVRNFGNTPVTVTGGTFTLATAGSVVSNDFRFLTQFPFTVQPATQQTLTIAFAPTSAGEKLVDMRLFSNEAAQAFTRLGSRGAVPSAIVITAVQRNLNTILGFVPLPFRFPFGTVATNTSATRTFALRNSSSATMVISTIAFVGANGSDFTAEGLRLPATVEPNATTSVVVRFRPGAEGIRSAQMTLANNIGYGAESVEVWGTGVAAKRLIVPVTTQILAETEPQTTSGTLSVTLTSTGRDTVRLATIRIIGKDASQFRFARTIPDGTRIANTRSSSATVFFAPTSVGVKEARLEVVSDAEFPVQYVELRARAAVPPASATIATLDARAGIGQDIDIPIILRNARRFTPGATIYANLRVNASILQPIGTTPQGQIIDGQRVIPLTLQVPASTGGGTDSELTRLRFRVNLGTDIGTVLSLEGVFATGATLRASSGRLELDGIPQAFIQSATAGTRVEFATQQGQSITLPIVLRNRQNIPANSPMTVSITFNASLLEPTNLAGLTTSVNAGSRTLTITVPRGESQDATVSIPLRAAIGNNTETSITVSNYISLGYPNGLLQTPAGGRFRLLGINQSGGNQLFFSDKKNLRIASTTPNPANDAASVTFVQKSESAVSLSLSSVLGAVMFEEQLGTLGAGEHTARLSVRNVPAGTYLLTLRNATNKETVTITIVR